MTRARRCWKRPCSGPELLFRQAAIVAVTGGGSDAEAQRRGAAAQRILRGAGGRSARLRFHEGGRAHLHRGRRRDRRAAGPGQPLDLWRSGLSAASPDANSRPATCSRPAPRRRGARAGRALPADLAPDLPEIARTARAARPLLPSLTDESAKSFFEDTWTVAPEADRIGYRFRKGRPLSSASASSRSAPAPIHRTSSMPAIPTARSRCPAASSRSSCIATPSPAAATP